MSMNKIIRNTAFILLAFAAVACNLNGLEPAVVDGTSLELVLKCTDNAVRATEPGQDAYNENTIDHIDYFIYTSSSTAAAAVAHGRVTPEGNAYTVVLNDLVAAGTLTSGGNCYIYVVANWPSTFTGTESVAQIQASTVVSEGFDTTTHKFVMDSKAVVEALVSNTGSQAEITLSRLASKLAVTVNIPASITVGEGASAVTYTPEPSSLHIYYLYATKKGTLDGSQMSYTDETKDNYFHYPYNRAVSVTGSGPFVGTCNPFYTYPQQWQTNEVSAPYFKVVLSWKRGESLAKPYYYKVYIPEAIGGKLDRNTIYKFIMNIGVLGSESDDAAVIVGTDYWVIDWNDGAGLGETGDISRGEYLDVARYTYYLYGQDTLNIPVISSHAITSTVTSATYTNYASQTPSTVSLTSGFSTTDYGRESFSLKHTLNNNIQSRDLHCSKLEFTIRVTNTVGLSKTITVVQYPSLYITHEKSNNYVFVNGQSNRIGSYNNYTEVFDDGEYTGATANDTYQPNMPNQNSPSFISDYGLTINFENSTAVEHGLFSSYYTQRMGSSNTNGRIIVNAPEGGTITRIIISYYRNSQNVSYSPAGTSSSNTQWNGSASEVIVSYPSGNNSGNTNQVQSISVQYTYPATSGRQSLGGIRYWEPENLNDNIYTIHVSNLSSLTEYGVTWYIADPRVETPITISSLRAGGSEELTNYKPTRSNASDVVAPKFKIASFRGAISRGDTYTVNFQQAQKRCASYQESGYPAGRWRVPTEAEIQFCLYLSTNEKIPNLFNGEYWASSGKAVAENGSTSTPTRAAVRCVYDAWYWGDSYVEAYRQTWSGWQTN